MNHYQNHKIVVHNHAVNGWMSTMFDGRGHRLGEQFYSPPVDKAVVIERARKLAGWFGVEVVVHEGEA